MRNVNRREYDAILAGLRMLMQSLDAGTAGDYMDILTDAGEHEGMTAEDIDVLCERLQSSRVDIAAIPDEGKAYHVAWFISVHAADDEADAARKALEAITRPDTEGVVFLVRNRFGDVSTVDVRRDR